jgi:hypothetical protein
VLGVAVVFEAVVLVGSAARTTTERVALGAAVVVLLVGAVAYGVLWERYDGEAGALVEHLLDLLLADRRTSERSGFRHVPVRPGRFRGVRRKRWA